MGTDSTKQVTDLTYLIELSKGNKEFVKDMIDIFFAESPLEVKSIEEGVNTCNYELIKSAAHKMRSTIPFVGLDKVIEKDLAEIEYLSGLRSDINKIENLFLKVKEVHRKAIEELQN